MLFGNRGMKQVLVVLLCFVSFEVFAQTTLPPVVARAPRMGGGEVICRGYDCAFTLETVQAVYSPYPEYDESISPEDTPVNGYLFCIYLRSMQPPDCNADSPPSVPGYDPSWQPNGCGTGPRANWFLNRVLSSAYSSNYSGNLNAPYSGVSFLAACNEHDRCWGSGYDRAGCDLAFRNRLNNSCNGVSSTSGYNVCVGFAGLYHSAVSATSASNTAYDNALAENQCAAWAHDMDVNGCPR